MVIRSSLSSATTTMNNLDGIENSASSHAMSSFRAPRRKVETNSNAQMSCTHTKCGAQLTSGACTQFARDSPIEMPRCTPRAISTISIVKEHILRAVFSLRPKRCNENYSKQLTNSRIYS